MLVSTLGGDSALLAPRHLFDGVVSFMHPDAPISAECGAGPEAPLPALVSATMSGGNCARIAGVLLLDDAEPHRLAWATTTAEMNDELAEHVPLDDDTQLVLRIRGSVADYFRIDRALEAVCARLAPAEADALRAEADAHALLRQQAAVALLGGSFTDAAKKARDAAVAKAKQAASATGAAAKKAALATSAAAKRAASAASAAAKRASAATSAAARRAQASAKKAYDAGVAKTREVRDRAQASYQSLKEKAKERAQAYAKAVEEAHARGLPPPPRPAEVPYAAPQRPPPPAEEPSYGGPALQRQTSTTAYAPMPADAGPALARQPSAYVPMPVTGGAHPTEQLYRLVPANAQIGVALRMKALGAAGSRDAATCAADIAALIYECID